MFTYGDSVPNQDMAPTTPAHPIYFAHASVDHSPRVSVIKPLDLGIRGGVALSNAGNPLDTARKSRGYTSFTLVKRTDRTYRDN